MAEIDNSMLAELEQESRLMRARNARLEAEVTVLTEMVRVLSDKVAEKETKRKWVGLTEEEFVYFCSYVRHYVLEEIENKLKEKNT